MPWPSPQFKMHLHPIVSFLVEVILNLLQLKFNGNGNGNGNQGGVSSDDSLTSPFNIHPDPVMILLGVLCLLLYSWVALAASTTAMATSSSWAVEASDLSAATISPSASSPARAATSAKIAVAETPLCAASPAASCSSSPAQATSSNALSSAVAEAVLSAASCSSLVLVTYSKSLSSAAATTVLSAPSDAASCSSPAATSNPSLLAQRGAEVVIDMPTSSPTVAISATRSSWISMILGKISNRASKLIAKIKCRPEQLMLMFASMAISTFGCLLFPSSAQYHLLYTSYALIIGFSAIFLCLLPRQGTPPLSL